MRSKRAPFFTVGMDDVKGVLLLQSFDRIIGVAKNEELLMEMKRLRPRTQRPSSATWSRAT